MEERIRAFLCLELPSAVREELVGRTAFLKRSCPDFKWLSPESLHITLKFLGEYEASFLQRFVESLDECIGSVLPFGFSLSCGSFAAFPDTRRARVVVSEVCGDVDSLRKSASMIERFAREFGFPPERRPFTPHITVARTRRPEPIELPERKTTGTIKWRTDSVTLMQSVLNPSGPLYTPLKVWKFSDRERS